jgi:predicted Ser/Thr protein kinase
VSEQQAAQQTGLGRYRLLGRLGEGGMGVVHLAETPDGEQVALKVLRPHVVGDDETRARLAREVTSLRRVRSPLVAEVIDADPWGQTPYVVTRYVRGPSLHERVSAGGPLAGAELVLVARGLAEALAAVHRVGVLHRDVKPSNVLLEEGHPVLIDFGLARLLDEPRLTVSGWLLGTPGYLAPEILHGAQASPAADVHAWAATVVYAATGRAPYGSGPAVAVMDRVRRGEHDLSGVPGGLAGLLGDALATDPQRRPTAEQARHWLAAETAPPLIRSGNGTQPPGATATRPMTLPAPVEQPLPASPPRVTAPAPAGATSVQPPAGATSLQPPVDGGPYAPRRTVRERLTGAVFGLAALALFVACAVAAPAVTAAALFVLVWLAGTASRIHDAARARRERRGRRRSDPFVTSVAAPAHLLVSLPAALALAVLALGSAALVTTLLATLGSPGWRWPALTAGALVGAAVVCWGPLSARVRAVGHRILLAAAAPAASSAVLVGLMLGGAAVLAVLSQVVGTWWWPTPGPPWPWDLSWLDPRR